MGRATLAPDIGATAERGGCRTAVAMGRTRRQVPAQQQHEVGLRGHGLQRRLVAAHTIKAVHESSGEFGRHRLGRGHKYLGQRRWVESLPKVVLARDLEMPWQQPRCIPRFGIRVRAQGDSPHALDA